jgi:carboxypeptidase C (cathepsin A)
MIRKGNYPMNKLLIALPLAASVALGAPALAADHGAQKSDQKATQPIPKERSVKTEHTVKIDGHSIRYTATAGTLLINNDKGKPNAQFFYVAYTRNGVDDMKHRPVTFLYNGGPGSSSIWLHMGAFGPMRVVTSNAKPTPPPPYDLVNNQYSLLDKTDLVFIDAIGTGFSKPVGDGQGKDFWGVDEDVHAFAKFIERYLTVNNRWNSPKFLLGESYGTTRSANLVDYLGEQGVAMNGVVLVSSILNYGDTFPGTNLGYVTYLPSYAAIAWYHHKLANPPADLSAFLKQVRAFASGEYAHALFEGSNLPAAEYNDVVQKLHQYTGLSEQYIKDANLRVDPSRFRAELLRDEHRTMGRYDARYEGIDQDNAEERPDYDPSDTAIGPAFTTAFHYYLQNNLKYKSDTAYKVSGFGIIRHWDWKHPLPDRRRGWPVPLPDVAANLAHAIRQNPHLKVFSANGYFDLATPFFKTEYDIAQTELPSSLADNISFHYYPSGHMIYLNVDSLKHLKADLAKFYDSVTK